MAQLDICFVAATLGSQRYILNAIYTTLSLSKPIFSAFFKKNEKNMFKNLHHI